MQLAIIIVNWNVKDLLRNCLNSVLADIAANNLSAAVWVVDNASTDGSAPMLRRDFPEVHVVTSQENLGFARGNNTALRALGFADIKHEAESFLSPEKEGGAGDLPETVLLLNPDTEVHPGALPVLLDFLQSTPRAGVAGPRLEYGDGAFQHSAFAFPGLWQLAIELLPVPGRWIESRLNGRYPRSLYEQAQPFRVGHPLGAAMCVRREAIQQVGLFDERYYMYVEEIDWVKRMASAGWPAYCVPAARITHFGGQSTAQLPTDMFVNLWSSRYRFYRQHYPPFKVWLAAHLVSVGMRRQAAQDRRAAAQGKLTQTELTKRQMSYQQVTGIWQRGET
jgi:GT2 family glycosyltransferase